MAAALGRRFPFAREVPHGGGVEERAGALLKPPQVTVGTIHSVKGGEADVVFLFLDLSRAGGVAYQRRGPERDAVIRLFYVGMTRARETLYVCQNESSLAVKLYRSQTSSLRRRRCHAKRRSAVVACR